MKKVLTFKQFLKTRQELIFIGNEVKVQRFPTTNKKGIIVGIFPDSGRVKVLCVENNVNYLVNPSEISAFK